MINKETILSQVSDIEIYSHYLGYQPKQRKKYKSPFRKENNDSLSFFLRGNSLAYNDFGTSGGDCFNLVRNLYNLSFSEALERITSDMLLQPSNNLPSRKVPLTQNYHPYVPKIDFLAQNYSNFDLDLWGKWGYNEKWLQFYNIHSTNKLYINDNLVCTYNEKNPVYTYLFKYEGKIYKKIYQPFNRIHKFLSDLNGVTQLIWQGEAQLDYSKNDLLIIGKSLKDVGSIVIDTGINTVAPQSEVGKWLPSKIEFFKEKFQQLVIYLDNDPTGIKEAESKSKEFGIPFIYNNLPNIPTKTQKDYTDLREYNKVTAKENLLTLINKI